MAKNQWLKHRLWFYYTSSCDKTLNRFSSVCFQRWKSNILAKLKLYSWNPHKHVEDWQEVWMTVIMNSSVFVRLIICPFLCIFLFFLHSWLWKKKYLYLFTHIEFINFILFYFRFPLCCRFWDFIHIFWISDRFIIILMAENSNVKKITSTSTSKEPQKIIRCIKLSRTTFLFACCFLFFYKGEKTSKNTQEYIHNRMRACTCM